MQEERLQRKIVIKKAGVGGVGGGVQGWGWGLDKERPGKTVYRQGEKGPKGNFSSVTL